MADFFRLFLDTLQFIWPMRRVEQWEGGVRFWCGRFVRVVGPGVYGVLPWWGEVTTVSMAESIVGTGRQDITTRDGSLLSFAATCPMKVVNPYKALVNVDGYQETAQEALMSVLSAALVKEETAELSPRARAGLMKRLSNEVRAKVSEYGIESGEVSFVSFVTNMKAHRLLIDQHAIASY